MKKVFKRINYLLTGFLTIGATSAIFSSGIVSFNGSNKTSLLNVKTRNFTTSASTPDYKLTSNSNNTTSTTNHIIEPMLSTSGDISLEAPLQYYASDTASNTGFAELTSSTNNNSKGNYDQITKYSAVGTDTGKVEWIVKKSDLGTLVNVIDSSKLTIKSIVYSHGSLEQVPALYVLLHSSNATNAGSSLFKIIWGGTNKGNYQLVQKISTTSSETYNYLEVVGADQILAFSVPKINSNPASGGGSGGGGGNTSTANNEIKFAFINNNSTTNGSTTTPSNKITIDQTLLNSIASNSYLTNIFKIPSTGIYYLVLQGASSKADASKAISVINLGAISSQDKTVAGSSNLINLDLSSYYSDGTLTNESTKYFRTHLIDVGSGNYSIVISQKSTTTTRNNLGKYLVSSFNLETSFGSTTSPFTTQVVSNYPNKGSYFINVRPLYEANSRVPSSYVAIDSSNNAVRLNTNLIYSQSLFNFESGSFKLGKIYNVYTKFGDSSWYAQMTDQTFAQMNNSTLVGQWDKLAEVTSSLEVPAIVSIKDSSEVLDGALFTKVANGTNDYDSAFETFLKNPSTYQKFLNVTFTDPRLGNRLPEITIDKSAFQSSTTKTYSITLTFKQKLRMLDSNGNIVNGSSSGGSTSTTTDINLGSAVFNFINGNVEIIPANDNTKPFTIPSFLKTSLPSQVKVADVQKYLFKMTNVSNPKFVLTSNDKFGILNVSIEIPYGWVNGLLVRNKMFSFTFGSETNPYFATNPLAQQDTSVILYTQDYLNQNKDKLDALSIKYAGTLPSHVPKKDIINDFVSFGGAFLNPANKDIISPLSEDDIEIVPLNNKGSVFVSFTFKKIGNRTNVKYSFETASVFKKDVAALDAVFFVFKENETVLTTDADGTASTPERLQDYRPSQLVPALINTQDQAKQLSQLKLYADFSSYFDKLLYTTENGKPGLTISATSNDPAGLLTISINLANPLPNSNTTVIKQTFSGFGKSGAVIGSPSTFSFNNMPGVLSTKSPSDITVDDLLSNNVLAIAGATVNLTREIQLEPINESGTLGVKVIFYNWVELKEGNTTIVPIKEFNRIYTGFPITKPPINSVIWKSYDEIDAAFQKLTPSNIVNSVQGSYQNIKDQLKFWASISLSLDSYLTNNPEKIEISYVPNNATGSLTINVKITGLEGDGSVNTFSTTISGFSTSDVLEPAIIWTNESSEEIQKLKDMLPSQLTAEQIGLFYNVVDSSQFTKVVKPLTNDVNGSVLVEVVLTPQTTRSAEPFIFQRLFSGFQKNVPEYRSTDWGLIAILGSTALSIFLLPSIVLLLLRTFYTKRKIVKKLDSRLDEERRRLRKDKPIDSIKDLID